MCRSVLLCVTLCLSISPSIHAQTVFFHESFDDDAYAQRGWYDNNKLVVTTAEHIPGSSASLEFHFLKGARTGTSGGGVRRLFTPSNEVYLSLWVKYSLNWTGSNKPYHPHQFHFVTDDDDKYVGPAYTNLTLYIEENEGRPLLGMQDSRNIDTTHIKQDLSHVTESRAVAGCNGSSDAYPAGDCYLSNGLWFNGKQWKADVVTFRQEQGPYFQNDWHHIEAYFRLNSIENNTALPDGIAQYWFDDSLLVNAQNIMLRTALHPTMKFNQFLIAPYIGDGSPIDQTMWVDEVTVGDRRSGTTDVSLVDDHWNGACEVECMDLLGRLQSRRSVSTLQTYNSGPSLFPDLRPGCYLLRSTCGTHITCEWFIVTH